jgi:hypothetical protein
MICRYTQNITRTNRADWLKSYSLLARTSRVKATYSVQVSSAGIHYDQSVCSAYHFNLYDRPIILLDANCTLNCAM